MKDIKTMKIAEVKAMAREIGIKGWWDMKKADLIKAIEDNQPAEESIIEDIIPEVVSEVTEEIKTEEDVVIKADEENVSESSQEAHRKNQKRLIEYKGETKTLTAWAKELGIRHQTLYNRIVIKGMDPIEAFEMPLKKVKKENETA